MKLKIAIVGCGKIADGHVEEIQKLDSAEVTSVCDLEPLMAEQLAVRYGIPRHYGSFDDLLAHDKPDVVHITTPPQSHLALARQALAAGCHICVEKPLGVTHEQTCALLDAVEASGKKLTVGYWPNFDPPALALRGMLEEGVLGDPVHAESFVGYNLSGAFGAALLGDPGHWVHRLPGKLFQNIIDHVVNKLTLLIPEDTVEVKAIAYKRRPEVTGTTADHLLDELRFLIKGTKATGLGNFSSHIRPAGHILRVYGTRNSATFDFVTRSITFETDATLPSAIGRVLPPFTQSWAHFKEGSRNVVRFLKSDYQYFAGMNYLLTEFYRSIRDDTAPPVSIDEMRRVSAVMDQIFRQVAQGEA